MTTINYPWIIARSQDMARHAAIAEAMVAKDSTAAAYYTDLVRSCLADITASLSKQIPTCDNCGETGEIRAYPGFTKPDHYCADCFFKRDGENSFTDFPLAGEAAQ